MKKKYLLYSISLFLTLFLCGFSVNANNIEKIPKTEGLWTHSGAALVISQTIMPLTRYSNSGTFHIPLDDYFDNDGATVTYSTTNPNPAVVGAVIVNENVLELTFTTQGNIQVQVTADDGSTLSQIFNIYSLDAATQKADFHSSVLEMGNICGPLTQEMVENMSFAGGSHEGIQYEWYVTREGEAEVNLKMINLVYDFDLGHYDIRLEAWNHYEEQISEYYKSYFIDGINDFKIHPKAIVCPGEQVMFEVRGSHNWITWTFGQEVLEGNYMPRTFPTVGTFQVKMMADTDCDDEIIEITKDVIVATTSTYEVKFSTNGDHFCVNDPIHFFIENKEFEFESYLWDFGNEVTSTEKEPVFAYESTGEYEVTLTVTNKCGNPANFSQTLYVANDISAHANFQIPDNVCPNTDVYFWADGTGFFQWDFGDGATADIPNPVNRFNAGVYDITLTTRNGCGMANTITKTLTVAENPTGVLPDANFSIVDAHGRELDVQELTICPSETVTFRNNSWLDPSEGARYVWEIGAETFHSVDLEYVFETAGEYTVVLNTYTGCGDPNFAEVIINVNGNLTPNALLRFKPDAICPGETVYFWDDDDNSKMNYVYEIEFGDGSFSDPIYESTEGMLNVLAEHVYDTPDTYNGIFSVTNICGNSIETGFSILVSDDDTRESFYHIENSTGEGESPGPDLTESNWSTQIDAASENSFTIPVHFAEWNQTDNKIYAFFWYGGFNPDAPPDGFAESTLDIDVTNGGGMATINAYVPINGNTDVGFLVGWYANQADFGEEPDAHGLPLDGNMDPIMSFQIAASGATNITPAVELQDKRIYGEWVYRENGLYHLLQLWEEEGTKKFHITLSPNPWGNPSTMIATGTFTSIAATNEILFTNHIDMTCQNVGSYTYSLVNDNLNLIKKGTTADLCLNRRRQLLDKTFLRKADNEGEDNRSACPLDDVLFKIAGGSTYAWDFGDGKGTSTEQFPRYAYTEAGEYTATVTAMNSCGHEDVIETTVYIDADNLPKADFWTEGHTLFVFEEVQFHPGVRDAANNFTYEWDFGDGTTSDLKHPVHVYLEKGDYEITLAVTNACGTKIKKSNIYIEQPLKDCFARFNYVATDLSVTFANRSSLNADLYYWDFGDGTDAGTKNAIHTYTEAGIYEVTLNIMDEITQCSDMQTVMLRVGTVECRADFDFVANIATKAVDFINNSEGENLSYFWDFGNMQSSLDASPSFTFLREGFKEVCLTVYNDNTGCEATFCKAIQLGTDEFKADFTFFTEENTVIFTNETQGYATDFYWTFGDGNFSDMEEALHEYLPGNYTVCLHAINAENNNHDQKCKDISVGTMECNIEADFSFMPISETDVAFVNNSIGNVANSFWVFGDGASTFAASSQTNLVHSFTEPGYYVVGLAVANADRSCHDATFDLIQIGSADCYADFEYDLVLNAAGLSAATFTNLSGGTLEYYLWDFGDGRFSTEKDPIHHYPTGMYEITLTVADAAGLCVSTTSQEIQVGQVNCNASFEYFVDAETKTASFSNESMGAATEFLWNFGNGHFSEEQNPIITYSHSGYYPVHLTVYNGVTWCIDEHFEVVTIGEPGDDIEARYDYILVADVENKVIFHNRSHGADLEYIWNFGDGSPLITAENHSHIFPESDYYNVCLTVVNTDNSMENTFCEFIQVGSDETDCFADFTYMVDAATKTVQFESNSYGANQYNWDFGDETSPVTGVTTTHTYVDKGVYEVRLRILNTDNNCGDRTIQLVNVDEADGTFYVGFDAEVGDVTDGAKPAYPVDFTGASLGGSSKSSWNFGDNKKGKSLDETTTTPYHEYASPGIYTVCYTVSDPNTGQTAKSCKDVDVKSTTLINSPNGINATIATYPNPFKNFTNIVYSTQERGNISISIYNLIGEKLITLKDELHDEGNYTITWTADDVPNGIYYLQMQTERGKLVKKIIVGK